MTDSVNVRELALEILLEVTESGGYSHLLLRAVLSKYQYLEKRERAFLTRLVEGTLKQLIGLDYIIDCFSKVKTAKLKPVIRGILRLSVYQLREMDSVPASAACNEAVKLAKRKGFAPLSGFVNGVLRSIVRGMDQISFPDEGKEPVRARSVRYSMPEWIVAQWMAEYGEERTDQMLLASQKEAPVTIRVNTGRITPKRLREQLEEAGVCVEETALPYAFVISGFDYLNGLAGFREGLFYIQDISSMMVAEYAAVKEGAYCIDVCGAPGGKGLHLAEKLGGSGSVQIRDLSEEKVALIEENIRRCGSSNVTAKRWDATLTDHDAIGLADLVIADLPCSGLGVLRRKADLRYRMTVSQEEELVRLQQKILDASAAYVKPGGALVYSTCTVHRAENEENVDWFLTRHPEFVSDMQRQIFPGEEAGDGFFIARLIRVGDEA